ncbi:uncharacterized protein LOC114286748 [Camellia sinensis]|uniref:uncharacterized protein LOC114286748 n=1 Tax=Camellia sinensis TaxID=4442 RepID=UPI001036379F|nr:uncharacterized protein LOC114286748 [Camellia sinensis]
MGEVFWNPIVEKIRKRLEGWNRALLSRRGRYTLVKTVLSGIPIYFMSVFKIPVKVAKSIEKSMRDFLWEGKDEKKKDHLVNWETVSLSKEKGVLAIGKIVARNMALLGKWLWRFPNECGSLWHAVIKSKYGIQCHNCSVASVAGSLVVFLPWNFNFHRNLLDKEVSELISLLSRLENVSLSPMLKDRLVWNIHSSDSFTCKSFLDKIIDTSHFSQFLFHNKIWKACTSFKVKVYMWILVHGGTLTNDSLQKKRRSRYLNS